MKTTHRWRALVAVLALAGCGRDRPELTPEPAAQTPAAQAPATSEVQGLSVTVSADEWPGEAPIRDEVTPLKVAFRNDSPRSVRLRYRELSLVGPDGRRFAALPVVKVEREVEVPRLAEGHPVIQQPLFQAQGFEAAPYYRPMYPTVTVYNQPFAFDPQYNENWYEYWADVESPSPEMIARALPEGVILPGGRVSGFLYFEHIDPDDVHHVRFRADVVDAQSGEILGVAEIPLQVGEAEPDAEY
jgi:hypothetical protein